MIDKKEKLAKSLEKNLPVDIKNRELEKELISKKDINDDYTFRVILIKNL